MTYVAPPHHRPLRAGDRVRANQGAGFHRGARGVVDRVDPGGLLWVIRDGASSPVFYHLHELDLELTAAEEAVRAWVASPEAASTVHAKLAFAGVVLPRADVRAALASLLGAAT